MRFSQREGYVIPRTVLQLEMMDAPLRNGIWSVLHEYFFSHGVHNHATRSSAYYALWQAVWRDFFKRAVDELPPWFGNAQTALREWFFQAEWYEVYDLVEFVSRADVTQGMRPRFTVAINEILKREMAGYALISDHILAISNPTELAAISTVLSEVSGQQKGVTAHIEAAIALYSDRTAPDYRNSIKESISAVESIAMVLAGDPKAELGKALKALEGKVDIHPALDKAFRSLYGYTSDADGIRHAMLEMSSVDAEDAQYMLVACSAFINYLRAKARKAGMDV
jgi:hypothetical protein